MRKAAVMVIIIFSIMLQGLTVGAVDTYGGYAVPVDICVNNSFVKCAQKPIMINNVTYIPLRAFSDAIGGEISWDASVNAATFVKNDSKLVFYEERDYCIINGEKKDSTAAMHRELMFVPVKLVSEALNYTVAWDDECLIVNINAPGVEVPAAATDTSYSREDIILLAKITRIESGSQPFNVKTGVAQTVLNRVKSPLFPNTVEAVIYDTKYGVQFPPAHTELMNEAPSGACIIAAKCALNGVDVAGNSLYFISTRNAEGSWAHNNRKHYVTLGGMNFYL